MHSRIFQISTQPIHKEDYIVESTFYDHWFLCSVADYVNDQTDRIEDIAWLKESFITKGLEFDSDEYGEYFVIADKNLYFAQKYTTFIKAARELANATPDNFVKDEIASTMYALNRAYTDDRSFYIYVDEDNLSPLDEFICYCEVDTKYYIGATIDYHF